MNRYEHEDDDGFASDTWYHVTNTFQQPLVRPGHVVVRNTDYEKLFLTPEDEKFLAALAVRA